ncbi:autotransporter assembly complex protein TamA [Pseudogemmobacter sonorensis]|uniref:autotransporter assembly complex protein TamA n=1 Tax=Pseudogemmobacter sonorensis TaxID=2989681 RepID=UPI003678630A
MIAVLTLGLSLQPAPALDRLDFTVAGGDERLERVVRAASLLLQQQADGQTDAEDLFAAARSDYGRILGALYASGHYSAVIRITLDGREASAIAPLDAPARVGTIRVQVDPGPVFTFSRTSVSPLAPGTDPATDLPSGFRPGETAAAGLIKDAADAAVLGWREAGHAKARISREDILADHRARTLSADLRLAPGPALRFGPVSVTGAERMEVRRILKIAGLREGEAFSQSELDRALTRLRRTGVFSTVTLTESDRILPGDLLPIEIAVAEQRPRRYSVGAELASVDGLSLTGSWMHRNLRGGAERLRVDGAITNIGSGNSGIDYELGITIDRPATLTPDTTAGFNFTIGHLDEVDYSANYASTGLNLTHYFSDQLTGRAGFAYSFVDGSDPDGDFRYRSLSLPLGATWDRRDSTTDARRGFYIDADAKPFLGFGSTGSGLRLTFDTRGYRSFGEADRLTIAARIQGGAILGSDLFETPRDDLFYSGGGGTVRGQPYRSLGVQMSRGGSDFLIGGTHMLAASVELRGRITESIGFVGFVDAGSIGAEGFFDDLGDWHAGAGLGLRYETGFGPIRFDVAAPVGGDTGDGVQIYIGLGQAF